jgi:hypothetical protein
MHRDLLSALPLDAMRGRSPAGRVPLGLCHRDSWSIVVVAW